MTDGGLGNICNADIRIGDVRQFCQLQAEGQSLMRFAMSQLQLSRTIADLAGREEIQSPHLADALRYRPKIMMGKSSLGKVLDSARYSRSLRDPLIMRVSLDRFWCYKQGK